MKMKLTKSIVLVAFCVMSLSFKPQNELKWYSFNEGYELAQKTGKVMLVDVYTDWCGWCKRMDRDTYSKPEIIEYINTHYIPIKFNPEITNLTYNYKNRQLNGMELMGAIGNNEIRGYPATVFLLPVKDTYKVVPGYYDATRFQTLLSDIITEFAPVPVKQPSGKSKKDK
jgi:uncharacterized protein YyaL (SSP411 family)